MSRSIKISNAMTEIKRAYQELRNPEMSKIKEVFPKDPSALELTSEEQTYVGKSHEGYSISEENVKIKVILEDIYYGIFAHSGVFSEKLDIGYPDSHCSSSFYNPYGTDWRVKVRDDQGKLYFTYMGGYYDDPSDEVNGFFRCSVISEDGHHKEFVSFHTLLFFLIKIVLADGKWPA